MKVAIGKRKSITYETAHGPYLFPLVSICYKYIIFAVEPKTAKLLVCNEWHFPGNVTAHMGAL